MEGERQTIRERGRERERQRDRQTDRQIEGGRARIAMKTKWYPIVTRISSQ